MELIPCNLGVKIELSKTRELEYNTFVAHSVGLFRINRLRVDTQGSVL